MAKVLGLISPNIRGKIGNTVFTRTNRVTIARAYQPIVANPKTPQQIINRFLFSKATEETKALRNEIAKIYGTNKLPKFSALLKQVRNSLPYKQFKSFNDLPNTSFSNSLQFGLVGANLQKESVAIFDLTNAGIVSEPGTEEQLVNQYLVLGKKIYGKGVDDTTENVYFGSDYALDTVNLIAIGANMELFTIPISLSVLNHEYTEKGDKQVGLFANISECGAGWKFIYSIPLSSRKILVLEDWQRPITESIIKDYYTNSKLSSGCTYNRNGVKTYFNTISVVFASKTTTSAAGSAQGSLLLGSGNLNFAMM